MTALAPIPPHVPRERVVDFDYYHPPGGDEDLALAWKPLHDGPEIVWTPHNGGHWIITRAEDIDAILGMPDPFTSDSIALPPESKPTWLLPSESNPPQHTAYRAVINPLLSPKAIAALEGTIRAHTIALIEGFRAAGECEFIADFASIAPITVFISLAGLPAHDAPQLRLLTEQAVRGSTEGQRTAAFGQLKAYVDAVIAARRQQPTADLMGRIASAQVFGRPLTYEEIHAFCTTILFGGLDTVVSSMGFAARFLAGSASHRRELRDFPELIPAAVEELLRRFSIAISARQVGRDFVYKGILFKAGDGVSIPTWLHGLDERRFANSLEVDFRRGRVPHAAFASGPHRCPGSILARTELRVFLEEWTRRIPEFSIKPGTKPVVHAGSVISVLYLPLVWSCTEPIIDEPMSQPSRGQYRDQQEPHDRVPLRTSSVTQFETDQRKSNDPE